MYGPMSTSRFLKAGLWLDRSAPQAILQCNASSLDEVRKSAFKDIDVSNIHCKFYSATLHYSGRFQLGHSKQGKSLPYTSVYDVLPLHEAS